MPRCAQCGTDLPLIDAQALWRDGKRICQNCAGKSEPVEKPQAPPVGEFDVWIPILLLAAIILLGSLSWILGVLMLVGAAIYVYYNAKKFGIGGSRAALTLLLAIVGLPVYAYDLHKLRKAQGTGEARTVVESMPPATSTEQQIRMTAHGPAVRLSTKFCRDCGAKIPRDSTFCEECGAKLA